MTTAILLVDLSGLFWANYHATADQEVSEAHKRTLAQVHAYRQGYDHVAICCDAPPYFRRDILPEYKANREAAPPAAREQLTRVKERLRADGLLLWEAKGFEADDVIAFACAHALAGGHEAHVISSDKDMHQLVCDGVAVTSPAAGVTYDVAKVREKHGVPPTLVRDLLALVGDSSDNIPGVPGIGPKTAAALLNEFGSLNAVLKAANAKDARFTKPKLLSALIEHTATAELGYRVIGLRTDVPLEWSDLFAERKPQQLTTTEPEAMDDAPEATEPPANGNGATADLPSEVVAQPPQPHKAAIVPVAAAEEWSLALEPRSQRGAWELAGTLHNSRLYQQLASQEAIYAVLLRGRALGLDATTSLAVFHNISGRITMHADLIEALVLRSGKAEYFMMAESDARHALYVTKRVGSPREQQLAFTIEDAADAQLVVADPTGRDGFKGFTKSRDAGPSNWDKYRATMLRHRCKTQLARTVYPDVVLGLYSPDEVDAEAAVIEARVA